MMEPTKTVSFNPDPLDPSVLGTEVKVSTLKPLNPDDLKPPEGNLTSTRKTIQDMDSEPIDFKEIYMEIKAKLKDCILGSSVSGILQVMRITNFIIASLMITIAIIQIIKTESFFSVIHDVFAVFYTIMFALILVAYELRTVKIDEILRINYGFMYHPKGRCLFLILISIFPFGMVRPYGAILSIVGFLNAYFNYFVITKHPSFSRGVPDYIPPKEDIVTNKAIATKISTETFNMASKSNSDMSSSTDKMPELPSTVTIV